MLDFRKNQRSPGLPIPRYLLLFIGLATFLFFVTWRSKPTGDPPLPMDTEGSPIDSRIGEVPLSGDVPRDNPLFPGVHAQYLEGVQDDTTFRGAESDAWFHLLELLESNHDEQLATASEGPVGYLQLDRQPQAYRGRLVTVSGTARGATELEAPQNSFGIERYYQVWVQPIRTDPELVVIYVLHLPVGFPLGESLDEPVSTTGFFFKRWAYPARGGILTAPLILARSLRWRPAPPAAVPESPDEQVLLAGAVALAFAILFVVWVWFKGRRPRVASDAAVLLAVDPEVLADAPPTDAHGH